MASFDAGVERPSSVRHAPGSMTTAMRAVSSRTPAPATHLRVGIAAEGRLEREEVLAPGARLVLDHDGSGREIAVHRDGAWHLLLSPSVTGRISTGSEPARDVAELPGRRDVALGEGARGRIEVAGRTVLFQLVEAPAPRVRPALPTVVRGGLLHQIDAAFTGVLFASLMIHFGVVAVLESADWPVAPSLAALPSDAIEMLIEPLRPEPDAPSERTSDESIASADPVPSDEGEDDAPPSPSPSRTPRASPDLDPALALAEALASVDHMLIGAAGPEGALVDVIRGGAVLPDAAEVLASAESVGIASTATPGLADRSGAHRASPAGDLAHLAVVSTGAAGTHGEGDAVAETGPRGHVVSPGIEDEFGLGEFDERVLLRAVRGRMARITRCYEHALGDDPTLGGRVAVSLTVEETGTLSHVRVEDNSTGSDAVAACVTSALASLRVSPAPVGGTVSFGFPFVFARADAAE